MNWYPNDPELRSSGWSRMPEQPVNEGMWRAERIRNMSMQRLLAAELVAHRGALRSLADEIRDEIAERVIEGGGEVADCQKCRDSVREGHYCSACGLINHGVEDE